MTKQERFFRLEFRNPMTEMEWKTSAAIQVESASLLETRKQISAHAPSWLNHHNEFRIAEVLRTTTEEVVAVHTVEEPEREYPGLREASRGATNTAQENPNIDDLCRRTLAMGRGPARTQPVPTIESNAKRIAELEERVAKLERPWGQQLGSPSPRNAAK